MCLILPSCRAVTTTFHGTVILFHVNGISLILGQVAQSSNNFPKVIVAGSTQPSLKDVWFHTECISLTIRF